MKYRIVALDADYQEQLKVSVGQGVRSLMRGDLQAALNHFWVAVDRWQKRNPHLPGLPMLADDSLRIVLNNHLYDPLVECMIEEDDRLFNYLAQLTHSCLSLEQNTPEYRTAALIVSWALDYFDAELLKSYSPDIARTIRRFRDFMVPSLHNSLTKNAIEGIRATSEINNLPLAIYMIMMAYQAAIHESEKLVGPHGSQRALVRLRTAALQDAFILTISSKIGAWATSEWQTQSREKYYEFLRMEFREIPRKDRGVHFQEMFDEYVARWLKSGRMRERVDHLFTQGLAPAGSEFRRDDHVGRFVEPITLTADGGGGGKLTILVEALSDTIQAWGQELSRHLNDVLHLPQ